MFLYQESKLFDTNSENTIRLQRSSNNFLVPYDPKLK